MVCLKWMNQLLIWSNLTLLKSGLTRFNGDMKLCLKFLNDSDKKYLPKNIYVRFSGEILSDC